MAAGLFVVLSDEVSGIGYDVKMQMTSNQNRPESRFLTYVWNIPEALEVEDGEYPSWCVEKDNGLPLYNLNITYDATMYHTYDPDIPDGYGQRFYGYDWNRINYIINNRGTIGSDRVQEAIWNFAGTPYIEYDAIVLALINDTYLNGGSFIPDGEGDLVAYLLVPYRAYIPGEYSYERDNFQALIIEVPYTPEEGDGFDDTAWAYSDANHELWDLSITDKRGNTKPLTDKWGWYFIYDAGDGTSANPVVKEFWAGAGQNDLSKGWQAGEVRIWNSGSTLYVKYVLYDEDGNEDVFMTEAHIYAGVNQPTTAAPGQFPYKEEWELDDEVTEYPFEIDDLPSGWSSLYIAVHGYVWDF